MAINWSNCWKWLDRASKIFLIVGTLIGLFAVIQYYMAETDRQKC